MADDNITGLIAAREQARREQTTPTPLPMVLEYDPTQAQPTPGEPPPNVPGPEAAPQGEPPKTPQAGPQPEQGAEGAQPPQDNSALNEAKAAFELLLKQFGITQPLGEKGALETLAESAAVGTTGDARNVPDLVRRVIRGLDLGLQVAVSPAVGAGSLAKEAIERTAPLPWQAAKAAGVAVPEEFTRPQETAVSRFAKELSDVATGMATGGGAMIGPLAKKAAKGGLGLPKMPRRQAPIRPATAQEVEQALTVDPSTLKVGDKLMAIKWDEMADDKAIADTVKRLRELYTEKHRIPLAETQALASQLREAGFEDKVLRRALLDGKTRAEAQALMDISKKGIEHAHELRESMRELQKGTPEYTKANQALQVQIGISGRYIQLLDDLIGEAGGTLRVAQEAAKNIGGERMDWMRDYAEKVSKGLIRDVENLPELWDALPREEQRFQFTRLATKHGWDLIRELTYDSMLFTFKGQMANLLGNVVQLKRPVDLTLASGIGTLRHAILGGQEARPLAMAAASAHGMTAALTEAHFAAWDMFLTAQSRFGDQHKTVQGAITGARFRETLAAKNITLYDPISKALDVAGFTLGIGNRALGAGDEYFKLIHYSGRSYEMALEDAIRQNVPSGELKSHMRQYLRTMSDTDRHAAAAHAHYATYTEPMSGVLRWMNNAADSPFLVGFIPFFKTLSNVIRVGFEHLPGLNFLVKRSREDILAGGQRADLALAKISEGTALAVIASYYYDAGILTGRGPDNKNVKQVLKDMGWQEDAVAFYDDDGNPSGYMSINRLDPANQAFILVSRTKDLMADMGADSVSWATKQELAIATALALGEYAQNISMMRGAKDAMETFTVDTLREAEKRQGYLARRAASLAVPSGLGQINAATDPYMREAHSFSDMVCSRQPWCSSGLYPQRKLNGEPRMRLQAVGPKWLEFASPLPYSKSRPDPVSVTIAQEGMGVTFPSKVIMGSKPSELGIPNPAKDGIKLTDAQFDLYQRLAGNELKMPLANIGSILTALGYEGPSPASNNYGMWDLLTAIVQTDFYKARLTPGPQGGKERVVLGIMAHYRQAAVAEMVLREKEWLGDQYDPIKDFRTQYVTKKLDRAEALGGPEIRRQAEDVIERLQPGLLKGVR